MPTLKSADLAGIAYPLAVTVLFAIFSQEIAGLTAAHPYPMGFLKFAALATYGECLKARFTTGSWKRPRLLVRAIVWGGLGVWFSADLVMVDAGTRALISRGLWPDAAVALGLSVWCNVLSGYAFFMMFAHYWFDHLIDEGFVWPWELLGRPQTVAWGRIVLISTVVFWIPAHTLTFSLDPHLRVICAAYLSIALGLILTIAGRPGKAPVSSTAALRRIH